MVIIECVNEPCIHHVCVVTIIVSTTCVAVLGISISIIISGLQCLTVDRLLMRYGCVKRRP